MEMSGETTLQASRQHVWNALNNPEILRQSIPGCESLDKTSDTEFSATVVSKVGPIKARFLGKVTLSDIDEPKSYVLTGEGQGGMAGFAKADIKVDLEAIDENVTVLRYGVNANVGGKLAQLGARLIDATARKSADEFFEKFSEAVGSEETSASPTAMDLSAFVAAPDSESVQAPSALASTVKPVEPAAKAPQAQLRSQESAIAPAGMSPEVFQVWADQSIKIWIADGVAVVTINRPKSRNAMTYGMWRAIPGVFSALSQNPEVRVILLTGAGTDFCAGADIAEFEQVRDTPEQVFAYEEAVDACCDAIFRTKKPTIAVINGYCLGGGAHLAMACDFRYAAVGAQFGIPAARLSIIYGVKATQKLLALVGVAEAKRILYGAQRFNASRALEIGFIDHMSGSEKRAGNWWKKEGAVTLEATDPMVDARAFAKIMAENAPLSVAGAKYILNDLVMGAGALNLSEAERRIAQAAASGDYNEGRAAFAEKRSPAFKGV